MEVQLNTLRKKSSKSVSRVFFDCIHNVVDLR